MLNIGIATNNGLIYEGTGDYGRALWPNPFVTPARIVFASHGTLSAHSSSDPFGCRFREDFFDPVSRIRRGRFYFAGQSQPIPWTVQPHPALPYEASASMNGARKDFDMFYGRPIWHEYVKGKKEQPLVLLGVDDRFTVWTIINIEAISTGEDMVTLKARSGLGILPQIDKEKVPASFHSKVEERLDTFLNEVHRSAPASVIDRARDAAHQVLLAHFAPEENAAEELSKLAEKLEDQKLIIAASAAKIIARLHARGKPNEREKREMREIREQDAELATQCVGTILCELGWADWVSK